MKILRSQKFRLIDCELQPLCAFKNRYWTNQKYEIKK
jgi:hypothetical protein